MEVEIFKYLGSVTFHMASKIALMLTSSNERGKSVKNHTGEEDFYSYSRPRKMGIFQRLEPNCTATSNCKGGGMRPGCGSRRTRVPIWRAAGHACHTIQLWWPWI